MFCPKCGAQLEEGDYKCLKCDWTWEQIENRERKSDKLSNNKKRKKILLIISIFIMIVGIVAIIYTNSDYYKIQQSARLINKGDYVSAIDLIKNIQNKDGDVIRNFIDVEKSAKEFLSVIENNDINKSIIAYQKLYSSLETFNLDNSGLDLPEKLREKYFCYLYAFMCLEDITADTSNEFYMSLYDAQLVIMNDVVLKQGNPFTINEVKDRNTTSSNAVKILDKYFFESNKIKIADYGTSQHCHTNKINDEIGIKISSFLSDMLSSMINECKSHITTSENFIEEYSTKYTLNEKIYMVDSQPYYEVDIHRSLNPIDSYNDIKQNRDLIIKYIQVEMMYYLISGNTPY